MAYCGKSTPKVIPEKLLFSLLNVHSKVVDIEIYRTLSYKKFPKVENLSLALLKIKKM